MSESLLWEGCVAPHPHSGAGAVTRPPWLGGALPEGTGSLWEGAQSFKHFLFFTNSNGTYTIFNVRNTMFSCLVFLKVEQHEECYLISDFVWMCSAG